jgi:hypothetical protein
LGAYIRGVGNELAEEDLLVGVEGVDDERKQLVDLSLEGKGLRLHGALSSVPYGQERAGGG